MLSKGKSTVYTWIDQIVLESRVGTTKTKNQTIQGTQCHTDQINKIKWALQYIAFMYERGCWH